jgi:hypothetical protein
MARKILQMPYATEGYPSVTLRVYCAESRKSDGSAGAGRRRPRDEAEVDSLATIAVLD